MHVGERRVLLVHDEVVGTRRREQRHRHAVRVLQLRDRVERRELVHLDLVALELQPAGVLVGDVRPGDRVEVRLPLLPVVRVALEGDRLADDALVPHERPGADRVAVERLARLPGEVVRDDPVREQRDVGEERRPLVLQVDDDRVRARRGDVLDRGVEEAPALRLGAGIVERELDVGRGHRLPVRELDALAELEGVGLAAVRDLVARGEPRLLALAVGGDGVERFHDLLGEPDRLVLEHVRLVERLRIFDAGDRDRAAVLGGRGRVLRARAACQRSRSPGSGEQCEPEDHQGSTCLHGHSFERGTPLVGSVYNTQHTLRCQ